MQLMKRFEPVFGEAVSTVSNKYTCISTVGCVPLQYTNIPGEQLYKRTIASIIQKSKRNL